MQWTLYEKTQKHYLICEQFGNPYNKTTYYRERLRFSSFLPLRPLDNNQKTDK